MTRLARWGWPLAALLAVLALDWLYRHATGVATAGEARSTFRRTGAICLVGALFLLASTRRWTLDRLGLLTFFFGVAGLFLRAFPVSRIGPAAAEWERDAVHAALDTGPPIIVLALVLWTLGGRRRRAARGPGPPPPGDPAGEDTVTYVGPERRGPEPGRRWTDRGRR